MSGGRVVVPVELSEVEEFAALVTRCQTIPMPAHIVAEARALLRRGGGAVEVINEGDGLAAVLTDRARALAAMLRANLPPS